MTVRKFLTIVSILAAAPVAQAAAQTIGTPVFLAPYRAFDRMEYGATFSDPGAGSAFEGHYRFASGGSDFGLRAGLRDYRNADTELLLGVDWRQRTVTHSEDFPLDGSLTLGVGLLAGNNNTRLLVPVGFSLGRRIAIVDSDIQVTPYFHPVAALVLGDDGDMIFGLGFGVDVRLSSRFEVRVAGAMGDYDGVSIGVSFLR